MERLRTLMYFCLLTSLSAPLLSHSSAIKFWNAANNNVSLPNQFLVDEENQVLVIAANNSVCHLSFDLSIFSNVLLATPDSDSSYDCINFDARGDEECQNYHHVLQFPRGPGLVDDVPLNETVLTCGSNAYRPRCHYRMRSTLQVITNYPGDNFCSVDMDSDTTSLWTSNNRLVSASKTLNNRFGIRVSDSPYTGQVAVATSPNDNFWINKSPHFVSMYEIGDHIYVFFREEAVEVTESVIYSRVARVCKNDLGSDSHLLGSNMNVFTTFIKARVSCSSGSGIPFHYNNIQDTFLLQSGSYNGTTDARHLYAIFTSADNGPMGSAVCVYSFYADTNDLGNVFRGNYKRRSTSDGSLTVQENYEEFSCEPGSRTVEDARDIQLMDSDVRQSNGPRPLLELPGYTFSKIVVDQVRDANGTQHEVMFVTAHSNDQLFLIKGAFSSTEEDSEQKYHVISTTPLGEDAVVTQMTLHGEGANAHIYVGTENGIYLIPAADCGRLTDCCSCVSARDPYCTYDVSNYACVAVGSSESAPGDLLQDYARGNTSLCLEAALMIGDTGATPTSGCNGKGGTTVATTTEHSTAVVATGTPSVGGLNPGDSEGKSQNHTWTIVGSLAGFIVGVVIGIILMAFFYQRGNIFIRKSGLAPRRRASRLYQFDSGEEGSRRNKDSATSNGRRKTNSVTTPSGKVDLQEKDQEYLKNNHEMNCSGSYTRSNDYTNMPGTISNGASAKFVLNPVPTGKKASAAAPPVSTKFNRNTVVDKGAAAVSASVELTKVAPPTDHDTLAHKTRSASAIFATSYGRGMTSSSQSSDPNLKSNAKLEESLTNHDREAYGRNILARQPSVDTTHKLVGTNGRTRLHPPVFNVAYDRRLDVVNLTDVPRSCSQC